MGGAVFLAYDAGFVECMGETPVFVHIRLSDDKAVFLFDRQVLNGPCRAYLSAERAVEFTVSQSRHQLRGKHSFHSFFHENRLEGVLDTDLHAFPATDANGKKFGLIQGARRPDNGSGRDFCCGIHTGKAP